MPTNTEIMQHFLNAYEKLGKEKNGQGEWVKLGPN